MGWKGGPQPQAQRPGGCRATHPGTLKPQKSRRREGSVHIFAHTPWCSASPNITASQGGGGKGHPSS